MSKRTAGGGGDPSAAKRSIDPHLGENLDYLRTIMGQSPDITIREFEYGQTGRQIAVAYAEGISDRPTVDAFVLKVLAIDEAHAAPEGAKDAKPLLNFIKTNATAIGEISVECEWKAVILSVLSGDTVIFVDGSKDALVCGTRGGKARAITEPSSQVVIRGPKDGFTETIGANVAQVRRRIRSQNLWLETIQVGEQTHTDIVIMYINGIAKEELVQEVKRRLQKIDTDAILESGYIEQLIQDDAYTPFPILYNTERPDTVSGNLLEGRVAIFVDGTPFVLIAPATFGMFFQSAEDYNQNFEAASLIRMLRFSAYFISLYVPSIYIAAITFHQEMIPTQLIVSLAAQRQNVPFPAFIEALIMEASFEILREAGLRMPRAIGQAVSIVGALVLGQAAVQAGLISSAMVIVVSITGISSFATASYDLALSARIIRFCMMAASGFLGFYGIAIFSFIVLGHMCGLRSFGTQYMSALTVFDAKDQKDLFVRLSWRNQLTRPRQADERNRVRQSEPKPDPAGEGHP
ncbi:spore germination protein [Paenibacillus artemisiicola]|nr:spore germination protein [Paenibacillus artemisiicola]